MTEELHIRVPADLAAWIRQTAEAEHRNINGQVNAMLSLARHVIIQDTRAASQRSTTD